jgi:hypothetical protein
LPLMDLMLFQGAFGHKTDLANDNFTRPENFVQKQEQTTYPERPGEPPCFNYMRHGSCRFQMNCKYHHPADRLSRKQVCNMSKAVQLDLPMSSE